MTRILEVDLYLGGDLGHWALHQIPDEPIGQVLTLDEHVAKSAQFRGLKVWVGDVNSIEFNPSEIGLSVHYPRVFKEGLIKRYRKMYNLHPSYLPWGRGYYPVFWALWEQTPAGATLHEINGGIDEGAIVAQTKVDYNSYDTGGTLFRRVRESERALFFRYWPQIVEGREIPSFQQPKGGTYQSKKEFLELKRKIKWDSMSSVDLVRLIRALSFPGYSGLEIELGGRQFEIGLRALDDE